MNIKLYVNTLNSLDLMKTYRDRGVYGFYTDYIKPQDLSVVGLQYISVLRRKGLAMFMCGIC